MTLLSPTLCPCFPMGLAESWDPVVVQGAVGCFQRGSFGDFWD